VIYLTITLRYTRALLVYTYFLNIRCIILVGNDNIILLS